jgi:hypothetical protein
MLWYGARRSTFTVLTSVALLLLGIAYTLRDSDHVQLVLERVKSHGWVRTLAASVPQVAYLFSDPASGASPGRSTRAVPCPR